MPEPLVPAALAYTAEGTPWSAAYGDVYHSRGGGPAQARHVFLGGTGLPARWRERDRFVVLETGFGLGLNFLATWQAWRDDPARCARLHYVSIEKHPFARADLEDLHRRYAEFDGLAAQLHAQWPLLVPGVHRLSFEDEHVVLTLAFADATQALAQLHCAASAIYLDGFAPVKNAAMWAPAVMKALARLSAPDAQAATWSAAREVRDGLRAAGFEVGTQPGLAPKREMTIARRSLRHAAAPQPATPATRRALVVGAGIAGAAVAERLAVRGWQVVLAERGDAVADATSGNHAGSFHPVVTSDDSLLARLTRAGTLYALRHWCTLEAAGQGLRWDRCGVLQLARDAREASAQRSALDTLRFPPAYVCEATREEASAHAGIPLGAGGLWFAHSGWVQPRTLVAALLARCANALDLRLGVEVAALEHDGADWLARDPAGRVIDAAPVVVLANGIDATGLARVPALQLRRVRGQVSHVPVERFGSEPPRVVVLRGGALLPAIDGLCVVGASYDFDDADPAPRVDAHAGNLERLERIAPGTAAGIDPATLAGRVGFRAVTPDRLPVVGALPQVHADPATRAAPRLGLLARQPGLFGAFGYGSRGLVWSSLAAELLASRIEGEPLPLEAALVDALDPARFLVRAIGRGNAVG
jgi:tRNA 5-methylaminomethyl-2-thiouridine biosynthesis bifunctional protein